jgi:NADH:ubiquinone oxidoreductase subunit 4 (subunit M)
LAAALIAVGYGIMMRVHLHAVLAALALEVGSIFFLVMSRQSSIFGWQEKGWNIDAKRTIVVEALAVATLLLLLVLDGLHRRRERQRLDAA